MSSRYQILSKFWRFQFFFSWPEAGLTNQVHIRHSDSQAPLALISGGRDIDFYFLCTFSPKLDVQSFMRTEGSLKYVSSAMQME